jgi:hypothetical protein
VIAKKGNIKFEIFPVYPLRFGILEIESKKKTNSCRGRAFRVAPSVFLGRSWVVMQFDKETSRTRDYCVAAFLNKSSATHRAAHPDPSLRTERLFRMTSYLHRRSVLGETLKLHGDRAWDDQKEGDEQEGHKESG